VSHSLSENWQLNARYRDFDAGYEYSALFLPFRYNFEDNTYLRVPAVQGQQNDEQALQFSASGDFEVAGLRNRLVVGVDYRDTDQVNITRFDPTTASILDWLNPDYSELPPNAEDLPLFPTRKDNVERLGIFAQNHLNVTDELVVSFGVRRDNVERTPQSDSTSAAQDLDNTSYQFGVNYELNENFTVFASYSESFLPNFDLDKNNNVIDPEQGKGYEIGVKGFELANSVNFTLSYFDIKKNNVSMADPTAGPEDPNPFGSIASAEQDSRGIELEWHGNVTDSWEVNGSFGVTDSEDMGQEDIFGAADMTASLWTTYTFNMIGDWGFAAGGGLTHVGERLAIRDPDGNGDTSDALYLDSHTLLTLYARANWQQWQFQLNLQNVTDEEYITSAAGDYARGVHPGAPFTAVASATYSF
jgi:iron complex outermembrane receptor protein